MVVTQIQGNSVLAVLLQRKLCRRTVISALRRTGRPAAGKPATGRGCAATGLLQVSVEGRWSARYRGVYIGRSTRPATLLERKKWVAGEARLAGSSDLRIPGP